jgi:hypothetical protein
MDGMGIKIKGPRYIVMNRKAHFVFFFTSLLTLLFSRIASRALSAFSNALEG